MGEAMFYAENRSGRVVVGQAVPSVSPAQASRYFSKTECFCFNQQVLQPGERREMPVRFVIDPDLPEKITTLTLSYTFFETPSDATRAPAPGTAVSSS
jgi:cytochrome c oxidase assembly protein subunit 11